MKIAPAFLWQLKRVGETATNRDDRLAARQAENLTTREEQALVYLVKGAILERPEELPVSWFKRMVQRFWS